MKLKFPLGALLVLPLAGLIAGCSILPKESASKTFFVLDVSKEPVPHSAEQLKTGILVGAASAGLFINSNRILFSDNRDTRSFYQFSFWTEPPPLQFTRLLLGKLESSGGFETVSRASVGAIGDYQLNTEIKDFYQDRTVSPPVARVEITANVVAFFNRRVIASQSFSQEVKLEDDNASGAVRAFSAATDKIGTDIAAWVFEQVRKNEAASPVPSQR